MHAGRHCQKLLVVPIQMYSTCSLTVVHPGLLESTSRGIAVLNPQGQAFYALLPARTLHDRSDIFYFVRG